MILSRNLQNCLTFAEDLPRLRACYKDLLDAAALNPENNLLVSKNLQKNIISKNFETHKPLS